MKEETRCSESNSKVVNICFIPTEKKYMCLSIRRYYAMREFMRIGAPKDHAKKMSNQLVS